MDPTHKKLTILTPPNFTPPLIDLRLISHNLPTEIYISRHLRFISPDISHPTNMRFCHAATRQPS